MVHILVYVISYMYVHFFLGDLMNVSFLFMKIIIWYMNISMWSTFLDKLYTTYLNWYVCLPIDIKCKERVPTCKSYIYILHSYHQSQRSFHQEISWTKHRRCNGCCISDWDCLWMLSLTLLASCTKHQIIITGLSLYICTIYQRWYSRSSGTVFCFVDNCWWINNKCIWINWYLLCLLWFITITKISNVK